MRVVNFTNFSGEDFTHSWDGQAVTVRAGQTLAMKEYLASHLAKHLIDRELYRTDGNINVALPQNREPLMERCIGAVSEEKNDIQAELAELNQDSEPVGLICPECSFEAKSKAGLTSHIRGHETKKVTEDDFDGLKTGDEAAS